MLQDPRAVVRSRAGRHDVELLLGLNDLFHSLRAIQRPYQEPQLYGSPVSPPRRTALPAS
jgi:hypothetical protein